jgi:pimeloyl-ACP methyl ester carboxylesterase
VTLSDRLIAGLLSMIAVAASSAATDEQSAAPVFEFALPAGQRAVGFKVVEQYDYSRIYRSTVDEFGHVYHGERARPIQTLIWYPAVASAGHRMTVADYVELSAREADFEHHSSTTVTVVDRRVSMVRTLAAPLRAWHDAPASQGHFPIVIYAPGYTSPAWDNADLCEYLASFGYVVIASPSLGATARQRTLDVAGVETRARDISFLIGYARTLPNTDLSAVAVMGHSWGGLANLFAAAEDNRIRALVALDGSLRYFPRVTQAGNVKPQLMTIPLLYFEQRNLSIEDQELVGAEATQGPSALNAWTHGDLLTVHMLGLTHGAFTSMAQRDEDFWWEKLHYWHLMQGDYGRDDAMVGYAWGARYTLRFMDAYLKHDASALAFLRASPSENGVPPHVMVVDYRAAAGSDTSFDDFCIALGREGFGHAAKVFAAFKQRDADFTLDETAVNFWAEDLIRDGQAKEAVELLELNASINPDSSGALVRLADEYVRRGETGRAVTIYTQALQLSTVSASVAASTRTKLHRLAALTPTTAGQ